MLAGRSTPSPWNPPLGGRSFRARRILEGNNRGRHFVSKSPRSRQSHWESDLCSAFDPTRTVARAGRRRFDTPDRIRVRARAGLTSTFVILGSKRQAIARRRRRRPPRSTSLSQGMQSPAPLRAVRLHRRHRDRCARRSRASTRSRTAVDANRLCTCWPTRAPGLRRPRRSEAIGSRSSTPSVTAERHDRLCGE